MKFASGPLRACAIPLFFLACCLAATRAGADATIGVVNIPPDQMDAVAKTANALGYSLNASPPGTAPQGEKMMFLEISGDGPARKALTAEAATAWMDYVQHGGRLLVSFSQPSAPEVLRIASMLPTIGWRATQDVLGPNHLAESDPAFFPDAKAVAGFAVPFYYPIRPWMATERGQARYDLFDRPLSREDDQTILPGGTEWWTRPLINREWAIRARGADVAASPLLLTGRYGAGRVAVFASSLGGADSPQAEAFWTPVLKWLGQDDPAPESGTGAPAALNVTLAGEPSAQPLGGWRKALVDLATGTAKQASAPDLNTVSPGNLLVSIRNPNPQPLKVKIVARLLSWEHAMVQDEETDVTLAGGAVTPVRLPLPAPSAISYQEIDAKPAFDVRLGVLSEDGSTLLNETKSSIDLTPAVRVAVHTEEIRTIPFPFAIAARPDKQMQVRNGTPVYACAYLPGAKVQATIHLANGARNIAARAALSDVTEPDNKSAAALITGFTGDHAPDWFLPSTWNHFHTEQGNTVTFKLSFPSKVTVTAVTLWGNADHYRNNDRLNPTEAVISNGDKELAREPNLAARFLAETGRVRIPVGPVQVQELTVTLNRTGLDHAKAGMELGQIEVDGTDQPAPAPAHGKVVLLLTNALTGEVTRLHDEDVTLAPLEEKDVTATVALPDSPDAQFYRLDGVFLAADGGTNVADSFPLLTVSGKEPVLQSMDSLEDTDFDSAFAKGASLGFIVTRGFRNVFDNAVGTNEIKPGWGQPDDLVWAYAHGFKQEGHPRTLANRLYLASTDMRHYSTPWRQFYDGEEFYDVATPLLVNRMKEEKGWANSDTVALHHSDRWDTGPSVDANHTWQDFEGFNAWLLARHLPGLQGRTLPDLTTEIGTGPLVNLWYAWQLERYVANVRNLRDSFAKEGKKLLITAQGAPVLPYSEAPEIDAVVRGSSDDCTWGEQDSDMLFTTGRQMAAVALNPTLSMSTLNEWQWLSGILGNFQWRGSVGTTEPARRHQYDRAFRGMLRPDGGYGAMSVYGYNTNGGLAYTLNELDYDQWEHTQIKQSLLYPTAPIGAGIIVSNARYDKPENALFDAEEGRLFPESHLIQSAVQRLGYAGVSVSFCGNAALLAGWKNAAPLILLNLENFSDAEQQTVQQMAAAGRPLVVFRDPQAPALPAAMAALFGVDTGGAPADGEQAAQVENRPVVRKGNCLYVPVAINQISQEETDALAPVLRQALAQVITFPAGTTGYGFISNGRNFAVVEDWREEGRMADLRVRAQSGATGLLAVDTNDSRPLATSREGADWVIHLPIRPADGMLVAFKEITP